MQLCEIECAVIKEYCSSQGLVLENEEMFCSRFSVVSREFTGVGFITELIPSKCPGSYHANEQEVWGKLGAILNSSVDTGYLVYIEDGKICAIEGFTYGGENWPDEITKIQLYWLEKQSERR